MERFLSLVREIPDAAYLLIPNEDLSNTSLSVMESLTEELGQFLLTENFDEEQIWGQLSIITKKLLKNIDEESKMQLKIQSEAKESINEAEDIEMQEDDDISIEENSQDNEEEEENNEDDEDSQSKEEENKGKKDEEEGEEMDENQDFFDQDEMVRFADEGELEKDDPALNGSESKEDTESDQDEKNLKYQDFYKDPENASSEEEPEKIFSMVNEEEMDRLEQKMISDKPWQLKGEVIAKNRPKNSLLDENLDFEIGRNPVPQTQTKVVTDEIEEIIKQRILDMVYDDVKLKKPFEKITTKTAPEDFMDYEKSKKSLAELYEEDFKKQVLHLPMNTELERAKKEITIVFRKLCYNLDLMSSLTPVPKPVVKDMEVKSSSVPALVMEEVLPFGTSKEQLANATEVFNPKNAVLKSKEEHTQSDKNNIRKRHKATLRTRRKERILKLMNKLAEDPKSQKFEYRRMLKEEKAKKELLERKKQPKTKFTRSSEFFKNFQELNNELKTKKPKEPKSSQTSKKVKL